MGTPTEQHLEHAEHAEHAAHNPFDRRVAISIAVTQDIEKEARGLGEEADSLRKESKHVHHLGDYYDLAELGIELGLVLCSIALMTKKKEFWYSSLALTALGSVLMLFGIYQQY